MAKGTITIEVDTIDSTDLVTIQNMVEYAKVEWQLEHVSDDGEWRQAIFKREGIEHQVEYTGVAIHLVSQDMEEMTEQECRRALGL